jgi:SAM-dependent methyltransferase
MSVDNRAAADQKSFYDERYGTGSYMAGFTDLFEICRVNTVREELGRLGSSAAVDVLDYGCGEGRYLPIILQAFPNAQITGCDVSTLAIERARARYAGSFLEMSDEHAPVHDESADVLISVEVLEHVANVRLAVSEIRRVLRCGGVALLTTPCANSWSLEWLLNRLRGGLQPSADGYGRFATDEPGHLRRLRSSDLEALLTDAGLVSDHFSFRAHLFTTVMDHRLVRRLVPLSIRVSVSMWDWRLWRTRRNGATMLVVARKPVATSGL